VPSGDFARLALGEIEPEQYGRAVRLSDTDRKFDAHIREWRREFLLQEFRRRRQAIFKQALLHGNAGRRIWLSISAVALIPIGLTASKEAAVTGLVVMLTLAVWLVRASYRRRRESFLASDESIRRLPVGVESGTRHLG
jgi:Flp pilus assembly protein TadB